MRVVFRWLRWMLSLTLFMFAGIAVINYQTSIYLLYQAKGQMMVLSHTLPLENYCSDSTLSISEKENLVLVEKIKTYSVDSLGYLPTDNYTRVFVPQKNTTLYVITACKPFEFEAYHWTFPIVGEVSYKGFFNEQLAAIEYNRLVALGYDVDCRPVSAWSTLGWFKDPILKNMLNRSKAGLSNLLFHELFHATYYAPSSVDLNENLANFIAHKATLRFLKNDTASIRYYLQNQADNQLFSHYMLSKKQFLQTYYKQINDRPDKRELKLKAIYHIADSVRYLPLNNPKKYINRSEDILKFKNAYFVDFQQYESLQDSLEKVFNKFYAGDLKIFIERLKLNKINY